MRRVCVVGRILACADAVHSQTSIHTCIQFRTKPRAEPLIYFRRHGPSETKPEQNAAAILTLTNAVRY